MNSWKSRNAHRHEAPSAEYWMTYSDLMAGLLMIFAVVLSVLIVAQTQGRETVDEQEARLSAQQRRMEAQQTRLAAQETTLSKQTAKLRDQQRQLQRQKEQLVTQEQLMTQQQRQLTSKEGRLDDLEHRVASRLGVKLRIIEQLRNQLVGYNVTVNPQTGAIGIGANVLFAENSDLIAATGKHTLEAVVHAYSRVFFANAEFEDSLSRLIVEGHTNDNGSYIYNLDLSQRRAFNVMRYILESRADPVTSEKLKRFLVASGRSSVDLRYDDAGNVDKSSSRRIELKFSLKDDEMIGELRNMLETPL